MRILTLAIIAASPLFAQERPIPDSVTLMKEVTRHQREMEKIRENYTCRQITQSDELDAKGEVKTSKTEEREVFFVNRHRIGRLVKKDGVDLSAAAEGAARNLAGREFVAFQSDVFALPFAPESFDIIYSIGVLHHTPDCEAAVKMLEKYLKPGGLLVVWLYSGYNKWYRFSDFWRRYTHKMKPENLHRILRVAVPFFYHLNQGLKRVPLVGPPLGGLIHHVFPVNRQKNPEARMLDTFDWYSPKYQSKHTYEQVFKWYEAMGMEDMRVGEIAIAVRGRKPARR